MNVEFVNVRIDRSLEIITQDEAMSPDDWYIFHEELVNENYKVSASPNPKYGGYSVSITGKEGSLNEGKCLSHWSSSMSSAYANVYLIHVIVCERGSWLNAQKKMDQIIEKALGIS